MTLRGFESRFVYTGSNGNAGTDGVANDPALSFGDHSPPSNPNELDALSELYVEHQMNSIATSRWEIDDWTIRARPNFPPTPSDSFASPGDWITSIDGANAGFRSRVVSNDGTTIVFESPTPALLESGAWLRVSKPNNLFPDVTEDQVATGVVDYRLICFLKTNVGNNNFRFYTPPVRANGCEIAICPSSRATTGNILGNFGREFPQPADVFTSPFDDFGKVIDKNVFDAFDWDNSNRVVPAYSKNHAMVGVGAQPQVFTDESVMPIWIRRTVPAGVAPGECVFGMNVFVSDAISQDATADSDPFDFGFTIPWSVAPIAEVLTLRQDRLIFTRGAARIIGKVADSQGRPLPGRHAFVEITSGPGSIAQDANQLTDEDGEVLAIYTAPTAGGDQTATLRLNLPGGGV